MFAALIAMLSLVTPPAAVSAGPAPTAATATDLPQIAFEKYTLANGLEVILHEDRRMPEIAVDVWY
jgi:zinc protease